MHGQRAERQGRHAIEPGPLVGAGASGDHPQRRQLARRLVGKLFGDRGYLAQPLAEQVWVRYVCA